MKRIILFTILASACFFSNKAIAQSPDCYDIRGFEKVKTGLPPYNDTMRQTALVNYQSALRECLESSVEGLPDKLGFNTTFDTIGQVCQVCFAQQLSFKSTADSLELCNLLYNYSPVPSMTDTAGNKISSQLFSFLLFGN